MDLEIVLKAGAQTPIYEQIEEQMRSQIISGKLPPQTAIPSIRALAKMLRVSVITVQKAYDELKRQGLIESVVGRGTIVASLSLDMVREKKKKQLEEQLSKAVITAKQCGIELEEMIAALKLLYKEDE